VLEQTCECRADSVLVFPCSGGSNVGQIANAVGVELTRQGKARMYCLAGMGAHISGMVNSAAGADYRIALDGCPVACARKTLENAGLQVEKAVVITDIGIPKNHEFEWSYDERDQVMEATISGIPIMVGAEGCGCGCEGK
jgi:uncharacterized metal-binding protein